MNSPDVSLVKAPTEQAAQVVGSTDLLSDDCRRKLISKPNGHLKVWLIEMRADAKQRISDALAGIRAESDNREV